MVVARAEEEARGVDDGACRDRGVLCLRRRDRCAAFAWTGGSLHLGSIIGYSLIRERPVGHVEAANVWLHSEAVGTNKTLAPQRKSVRLGAPRLTRVARRWVADSGRNLVARASENTLSRLLHDGWFFCRSPRVSRCAEAAVDRAVMQRRPALAGLLRV